MVNNEILNGIASVCSLAETHKALYNDVIDPAVFEQEAVKILELLCSNNPSLLHKDCIQNHNAVEMEEFGVCQGLMPDSNKLSYVLCRHIPQYIKGGRIVVPVKIDYTKCFTMVMEVEGNTDAASVMAQYILLSALHKDQTLNFRCIDMVKGGSFFSVLHNLINKFPAKSGGIVYKSPTELDGLLKDLDVASSAAIGTLGSLYDSVDAYNQANKIKISKYVNILYLSQSNRSREEMDLIRILLNNRRKNGMNFILVGDRSITEQFADSADFYIRYASGNTYMGYKANLPFAVNSQVALTNDNTLVLEKSMQDAEMVDTIYANHPELHTEYLTMDSAKLIRIPFALDRNGIVQYFEIGGEAPSHALISGTTGNGKSVALHTLIMQIIHNYHPDDVEIWAIDYKAVEFDWYIQHKSSHFRVIAHDTSTEFSLSLLDLLYEEYNSRMEKFLEAGVKNIGEYRKKRGSHSMPRIVVFIDEFQIMTQAVQAYTGNTDYRTILENLLKLTRAMGISFVLCSQTIASGLSGLTESAKDQIGCRLCLKHDDKNEIRETLMLSGQDEENMVALAKNLRKGQGIYKRSRLINEHSPDGKAYEYKDSYILFISDEWKEKIIEDVNEIVGNDFTPKDEIFIRGGGRIAITEKRRHPIQKFINSCYVPEEGDCIEWYPAAPTTLADAFRVRLENNSGANILLVGENSNLRESILIHSLCGFLMNPDNHITVSLIEEENSDRKRMLSLLKEIRSDRLTLNIGIKNTLHTISTLRKIPALYDRHEIYVWYGLDKIKNEIFKLNQDKEETVPSPAAEPVTREDKINDLMNLLSGLNSASDSSASLVSADTEALKLTVDDCKNILKQAFEVGPENNQFHFVIYNNNKSLKKSGMINLDYFENRVGTRMSVEDSYDLFGSSSAINKTNDDTVIYYTGSGQPMPLRPYLLPNADWYRQINSRLELL